MQVSFSASPWTCISAILFHLWELEVLLLSSWQVPSLPCLLALWSGVLAVMSLLSISVCLVLTLLLMFCACSHLHSQLVFGPIYFFTINHVPLEVFNVNQQV